MRDQRNILQDLRCPLEDVLFNCTAHVSFKCVFIPAGETTDFLSVYVYLSWVSCLLVDADLWGKDMHVMT